MALPDGDKRPLDPGMDARWIIGGIVLLALIIVVTFIALGYR